eukprot:gnl/Hemi2/17206_TR5726_c0_g1_i1.p3 gnl/Hemi2/17206_TR5726_c0_g1~~gnl/Hemi2/17206_TR5726_c0_g1_i1.p3  ORF type:complete len:179 (+),score=15.34 gnl/Hemi2/17206_TR5726_c0_g1_i1:253-789(+)
MLSKYPGLDWWAAAAAAAARRCCCCCCCRRLHRRRLPAGSHKKLSLFFCIFLRPAVQSPRETPPQLPKRTTFGAGVGCADKVATTASRVVWCGDGVGALAEEGSGPVGSGTHDMGGTCRRGAVEVDEAMGVAAGGGAGVVDEVVVVQLDSGRSGWLAAAASTRYAGEDVVITAANGRE